MLRIHLQEGFSGDTVIIRVDGREVARREGVTTQTQIGAAEVVDVEVGTGPVSVETEVVTKGIAGAIRIERPGETGHVGISVAEGGRMEQRAQKEPFLYA
jgi:hypothetical protein